MAKLTGTRSEEFKDCDDRTLLMIVAIRQKKAMQETLWTEKLIKRTGMALGLLQVIDITIDIVRGFMR